MLGGLERVEGVSENFFEKLTNELGRILERRAGSPCGHFNLMLDVERPDQHPAFLEQGLERRVGEVCFSIRLRIPHQHRELTDVGLGDLQGLHQSVHADACELER